MTQQPPQSGLVGYAKLHPIESALAAILLLALLATAYFYQQTTAKKEDLAGINQAVERLQRQLSVAPSPNADDLRAQLERLKAEVTATGSLPTEQTAVEIGTNMISYADQQNLRIISFEDNREAIPVGGAERLAIRYAFTAEGQPQSLVGVLTVLQTTSSAIVEDLAMDRSDEDPNLWTIELQTAVFFAEAR